MARRLTDWLVDFVGCMSEATDDRPTDPPGLAGKGGLACGGGAVSSAQERTDNNKQFDLLSRGY